MLVLTCSIYAGLLEMQVQLLRQSADRRAMGLTCQASNAPLNYNRRMHTLLPVNSPDGALPAGMGARAAISSSRRFTAANVRYRRFSRAASVDLQGCASSWGRR